MQQANRSSPLLSSPLLSAPVAVGRFQVPHTNPSSSSTLRRRAVLTTCSNTTTTAIPPPTQRPYPPRPLHSLRRSGRNYSNCLGRPCACVCNTIPTFKTSAPSGSSVYPAPAGGGRNDDWRNPAQVPAALVSHACEEGYMHTAQGASGRRKKHIL